MTSLEELLIKTFLDVVFMIVRFMNLMHLCKISKNKTIEPTKTLFRLYLDYFKPKIRTNIFFYFLFLHQRQQKILKTVMLRVAEMKT